MSAGYVAALLLAAGRKAKPAPLPPLEASALALVDAGLAAVRVQHSTKRVATRPEVVKSLDAMPEAERAIWLVELAMAKPARIARSR